VTNWQASGANTPTTVIACPRCGGKNARTLRVIHDHGTSTSRSSTSGYTQGMSANSGRSSSYSTTTTRQTAAAKAAAPPTKRRNGVVLIVFALVVAAIGLYLRYQMTTNNLTLGTLSPTIVAVLGIGLGIVFLIIGGIVAVSDSRHNSQVFPDEMAQWDRTWACQRCGTFFVV
jgi:hypothetical protein